MTLLKKERLYASEGAQIRHIHFAGLRPACEMIDKEYNGKIRTFRGGESAEETLLIMGVPESEIPSYITNGCKYDNELLKFGESIIAKGEYADFKPFCYCPMYSEYSCAMKSHFRKFGNQMSGSGNHLCNYASLLA